MSMSKHCLSAGHAPAVRLQATFAAIAVLYGCQDTAPVPAPPIDARIWRMIQCVECIDNERANVVAMQDTAVPALRYLLLHGPPDNVVASYDSSLRTPRPATPPATGTFAPPAHVVDGRVQDFIAFHRIRSSTALGLIGTDSAHKALCEGTAMQFRDDVKRVVQVSLRGMPGPCP
jgi:hypothetical protein